MSQKPERDLTVVTVFGILMDQGRALLIRRAAEPYRGQCTVPGGHKIHGESLKEAARREILEETGLTMIDPVLRGLMEVEVEGERRDFISFYFSCPRWSGTLTPSPEGELFWADHQAALAEPALHPAFRALAPRFFNPGPPFLARARVAEGGQGSYEVGDF